MAFNFQTFLKGIRIKNSANPAISSNTLANPTVVTTAAPHGLISGNSITIAGSNSTPVIDGARTVTVLTTTTFTVPVNVTVAGTAGTYVVNNLSSEVGDISVDVSTGKAQYHNGTTASPLVTEAHSATLTNKTFDADGTGNSITNIENADIKTGAAIDRAKLANGSNNHVIVNDGSGVMVSQAQLSVFRGGTGIDTSVSSGVAKVAAGTWSVSSIVNGDITDTTITDAKLATISTPLKVSNSATTATSANTASAIVARDGTNNFSAGTITANLTGNVSGTATNVTGTVAIANGGTGQVTQTAAYDALNPNTTKGDLTVRGASNNVRLSVGANEAALIADSSATNGVSWKSLQRPDDLINYALTATVSANALTINIKSKDGSTSPDGLTKINFRNITATTGTTNVYTTVGTASLTINTGSTLGSSNGVETSYYVYACYDNATGLFLYPGVSQKLFDEGSLITTIAEGGGSATSATSLYTSTALTNTACRIVGRIKATEATAGIWATAPSEISLPPFNKVQVMTAGTSVGSGQLAKSAASNTPGTPFSTTSTTLVDLTNNSITITTTGRPVMLATVSASTASANNTRGSFEVDRTSGSGGVFAGMSFLKDGVVISSNAFGDGDTGGASAFGSVPASSFHFIDTPVAGTYTYKVQVWTQSLSTLYVNDVMLMAYEL